MKAPPTPHSRSDLAAQRRCSKELIAGVEEDIEQLHQLNAWKRIGEFALFTLLYALGFMLVPIEGSAPFLTFAGVICMGVAFNLLPILLHDGQHGLLAQNVRLNHLISFLVGIPIAMSTTAYSTTHANHHYELGRKLDFSTYEQHVKRPGLVWVAYLIQLLAGSFVYTVCVPILAMKIASRGARLVIVAEYLVITGAFYIVFRWLPIELILVYWVFPILVVNLCTNIRGVAAHALGDVENIYLSSRTIKSSRLVSYLFLFENYHLEHHLFPGVPSYHLPGVHALIWCRLPEAIYAPSYLSFLFGMAKAAIKNDLGPLGVVRPLDEGGQ